MFVLLSEKCIEDFSLSKKIVTNSLSTNGGEVIGTFLLLKKNALSILKYVFLK